MKIEDIIAKMKDGPTTTVGAIGLVVTGVSYFKGSVEAATKALSDMGYTLTPDKETWLYMAVGIIFVKMIFLDGGKKEEQKS
jgi:hypothetical protein